MTTLEIAEETSAAQVVAEEHRQIDTTLDRVTAVLGGPTRDLLLAHDIVVGLLSRHLLGVEVAVCPVAARRLPDGRAVVRAHLTDARRLERTMYEMEQILWGDARAPRVPLQTLHQRLLFQMARHRDDEERMLATLEDRLVPAERAALAAQLQHATVHAPSRPHPSAVRRLGWTRMLYRPVAGVDHVRDALASRGVPDPSYVHKRPRRVGLWGAYILGGMLPSESADENALSTVTDEPKRSHADE